MRADDELTPAVAELLERLRTHGFRVVRDDPSRIGRPRTIELSDGRRHVCLVSEFGWRTSVRVAGAWFDAMAALAGIEGRFRKTGEDERAYAAALEEVLAKLPRGLLQQWRLRRAIIDVLQREYDEALTTSRLR